MNGVAYNRSSPPNPISRGWQAVLPHIGIAVFLSGISNFLLLTPTLYLLGLYQRVVPAASVETLIGLSVAAVAAVSVVSVLDGLRIRVLAKASVRLNRVAAEELILSSLNPALSPVVRSDILKNFDMVRQTMTGPALIAVLDTPWVIVFVGAAFLLDPVIGAVIAVFALALVGISFLAQRSVRARSERANLVIRHVDAALRANIWRAGVIQSSGMRRNLARRRYDNRIDADALFVEAVGHLGDFNAFSRWLRQSAQVVVLGTAAYLVVRHQAQPAIIFASSLLLGRTLAPFDQIVGSLRQVLQAKQAVDLLDAEVFKRETIRSGTDLPKPRGDIEIDQVVLAAPGQKRILLRATGVELRKGDVAIISGPSGAGKSTLLSAIVGGYPLTAGSIRHDGTDIREWAPDEFAQAVGYGGPDPILLGGTLLENIARFDDDAASPGLRSAAQQAAKKAGAHDMIMAKPKGYDTPLGLEGEGLSSGQAHRITLARALYGDPELIVLDEPDAHLDAAGTLQLCGLLTNLAASGKTLVVVSHKPELMTAATRRFELVDGELLETPL